MPRKECILEDRLCTNCGDCNMCDIDSSKICTSCGKCIDDDADYRAIGIDDILELEVNK
ncbi:MAG: hypothetical protein PWR27_1384 [Petroclostridium sp.]|uniref:hypothetical protein n=1 Tax=Petroclostridium xylanilyticum TaxID=1792311 RepID=UPI0018E3C1C8|nr:hypothetical protein [Petroclostridium xylanilyticum]MBZ4646575.1 hypothetical protein [Clostridia bacterium]MDK2810675.1 hypothetical protein [Petroclostridium sp.]